MSPELSAAVQAHPVVLVAFSSPSCPPCRALKAAMQAELPLHPHVAPIHVDITADPVSAQACGVRATPTLVGFVDGRPVATAVGYAGPAGLRRFLARLT